MGYEAKILLDSVSPDGVRLTTMEVTFPRIVLAEFNTHRMFCLAGDAELEFDLPAGSKVGKFKRVHRMRLDDFVDKWLYGARRAGAKLRENYDTSWIDPGVYYMASDAAARFGMATASNLNHACKTGVLAATKFNGRWNIRGEDLLHWRNTRPEHTRFDMRAKLSQMRIRQINEDTGDIQTSNVVNVFESGEKEVLEVVAGDFSVAGSKDHRIFTTEGWKTIGELTTNDYVVVRKFGKRNDDRLDPFRLKKIDGVWRSVWQRDMREELRAKDVMCRRCRQREGVEIHHVVPVHEDPSRAFDKTNITLLCDPCHDEAHKKQGWQGGTYLYGAAAKVERIVSRGIEKTYDLEIAGKYPNFIANGIVVHNSRNSASSRAIPVEKMLKRVEEDPFIPVYWGKNQKGMKADQELTEEEQYRAIESWLYARDCAVKEVKFLLGAGVHKQITNRLLEPWLYHTVIVTATEWDNFFALRCHNDAQPEIRKIAVMMESLYRGSTPRELDYNDWHMPLVTEEERVSGFDYESLEPMTLGRTDNIEYWKRVSAGRCARVSYLTHDGKRDPQADVELCDKLAKGGHMSPFEHVARPMRPSEAHEYGGAGVGKVLTKIPFSGNFLGWVQFRKEFANEAAFKIDAKM